MMERRNQTTQKIHQGTKVDPTGWVLPAMPIASIRRQRRHEKQKQDIFEEFGARQKTGRLDKANGLNSNDWIQMMR